MGMRTQALSVYASGREQLSEVQPVKRNFIFATCPTTPFIT